MASSMSCASFSIELNFARVLLYWVISGSLSNIKHNLTKKQFLPISLCQCKYSSIQLTHWLL